MYTQCCSKWSDCYEDFVIHMHIHVHTYMYVVLTNRLARRGVYIRDVQITWSEILNSANVTEAIIQISQDRQALWDRPRSSTHSLRQTKTKIESANPKGDCDLSPLSVPIIRSLYLSQSSGEAKKTLSTDTDSICDCNDNKTLFSNDQLLCTWLVYQMMILQKYSHTCTCTLQNSHYRLLHA